MTRMFLVGVVLFIMQILLGGCTRVPNNYQVVPERITFDDSYLPDLSIKNPIRVVAYHTNKPATEIICNFANAYIFNAKLDELTDAAAITLKDVLKRRNIQVTDNAKKTLEIAIIGGNCEPGAFSLFHYMKLKVTYDNGVTKEFTGSQGTGNYRNYNSTIPYAMGYAVLEMLKDDEVVRYLNN